MLAALGVGALVAGGVVLLVAYRLDDEVRSRAELRLAASYPGLKVVVGSARVVADKGLELRAVRVYEPGAAGPRAELLYVDEIFVECPTNMVELMADPLPVTRVVIRRPSASATLRADGTWSLARLFPPPCSGGPPPPLVVENGTIRIFDPGRQPASMFVIREINVRIDPINPAGSSPSVRVKDDLQQPQKCVACPDLHLTGVAGGDHFQRLDLEGLLTGGEEGVWVLRGRTSGVQLSPELRDSLPGPASDLLAQLGELRGRAEVDFSLQSPDIPGGPLRFAAAVDLVGGHLADPQLPVALTDIAARLEIDNRGWRIPTLTARQDTATVSLSARRDGFAADSPTDVRLAAKGLRFDYRLVESLPPAIKSLWDEFRPSGIIDAQATLASDGRDWKGNLNVECIETGFVYQGFPYPVRGGVGRVTLHDNVLAINLRALAGPQPVAIRGEVRSPGPNWHGWLDVRSGGPVPIDARVLAALPVGLRPIAESFEPHGGMIVAGRLQRTAGGPVVMTANLGIVDGDVRYEHFPYPLRELTGRIELAAGTWWFRDLAARNGSAKVTGSGHWSPGPEGGHLQLAFDAAEVPLDDTLREALPRNAQQAWAALGPQGSLDRLAIGIVREPGMRLPSLDIRATKIPADQNPLAPSLGGRGLAFAPSVAPYRFEQVTGSARYRDGLIELHDLRATHGTMNLAVSGAAQVLLDGRPRLVLTQLAAERVALDRDLLLSLPEAWRAGLARTGIAGQINARGSLEVIGPVDWGRASSDKLLAALQARWDLGLELKDVAIQAGVPLSQVRGKAQLAGGTAQGRFLTRGELALDSLVCRDVPVTQVVGPFSIDNQFAALGTWANRADAAQPPRRAGGKLFGGALAVDAQASLIGDGAFQVQSSLSDGSLLAMCQEMLPGTTDLRGKVFAGLELSGHMQSTQTLRGRGNFKLRDADLYELPVVLSTLKLLRSRTPDKTAFNMADGEFNVVGDQLVFRDLRLEGDAVTLRGQGNVSLERDLDLTLHSVVGRNDLFAPLLSPLLGEASRQILEIRLTGTLDRPELDSRAFPALKESLDRLFPEIAGSEKREATTNPWAVATPDRNGSWRR